MNNETGENSMNKAQKPFPPEMRVIDRTFPGLSGDILVPFAIDELECGKVGQGELPLLHLWTHRNAMVLGIRDGKLPHAREAMRDLSDRGVEAAVRHSGGAAVPLDGGVLNVSLVLPKPAGALDFREDFRLMVRLLDACVRACGLSLQQGEVEGSYCPGEFDLSIGGRKFCGIAQRRQTRAIAVQAFIVVEGSGEERVRRAQAFYRAAVGNGEEASSSVKGKTNPWYPEVRSGTVASLAESGLPGMTVEKFKALILSQLKEQGTVLRPGAEYGAFERERLREIIAGIRRRYSV